MLADSSRIVSVYFDGQKKIITTDAATVGEVLNRLEVQIYPGDLVEPAVATNIPEGFFNVNVYRSRPVVIVDGSRVVLTRSALQSPRLVAQGAGLTVYPEDRFTVTAVSDFVGDGSLGEKITVDRATPVTLVADGQTKTLRTQAATVAGLIEDKQIPMGAKDTVSPAESSAVTPGLTVTITRVSDTTLTVKETLPRKVTTIYDNNLARGITQVRTEGSDGSRTVTYHIRYNNGVEISRETLKVADLVEPAERVEVVGTKVFYANEVINLAAKLAADRGWVNDQWDALYNLWTNESHFNPAAVNPYSGACGIPQAYPCGKMPGFPGDPSAQINWGLDYIQAKYGTPANAWAFWTRNHSY